VPLTGISCNLNLSRLSRRNTSPAVMQRNTSARIRRWRGLIQRSVNVLRYGMLIACHSSHRRIAEHHCRLELALDARHKAHGGQATPHQSRVPQVVPRTLPSSQGITLYSKLYMHIKSTTCIRFTFLNMSFIRLSTVVQDASLTSLHP
jgi:hypothetical protein